MRARVLSKQFASIFAGPLHRRRSYRCSTGMHPSLEPSVHAALRQGVVIPAHPLALTEERELDEEAQRTLTRYYLAAGAGGIAVAVHTTQFEIRAHGLLRPVLELAAETARAHRGAHDRPIVKVAGICGRTGQAVEEARLARDLGYDLGLLNLSALPEASDDGLIEHAREVGRALPLFGFYLQPAVGGRELGRGFWRRFAELPQVVAIKIAPFDRYRTLDVMRAVAEVGRAGDVALYTGNDDAIVADLLTEFRTVGAGKHVSLRIVGGLLGQWAVWTRRAVELLQRIQSAAPADTPELLALGAQLTDANAAIFDARNAFRGCIPGIHEILVRQGLLPSTCCLDPDQLLSPGQREEIDRVLQLYPHLADDDFVAARLEGWRRA